MRRFGGLRGEALLRVGARQYAYGPFLYPAKRKWESCFLLAGSSLIRLPPPHSAELTAPIIVGE